MIRASAPTADGGTLIVLGLTPGNLRRLREGQPIYVDAAELGAPAGVKVAIMFGQTERAIVAELRAGGIQLPDGADDSLRDVEREHREKGTRS